MTQPHDQDRIVALERERDDYKECYEDVRRNLRRIDVAMHGEDGAAKNPSGCDLVGPAEDLRERADHAEAALLTLQTAVKALAQRMQTCSRYKSHDLGYEDSVSSSRVDDWADELIALLPDTAGTK